MRIQAVQGFFSKELLIIELNGRFKRRGERDIVRNNRSLCITFALNRVLTITCLGQKGIKNPMFLFSALPKNRRLQFLFLPKLVSSILCPMRRQQDSGQKNCKSHIQIQEQNNLSCCLFNLCNCYDLWSLCCVANPFISRCRTSSNWRD